VCGVWQRFLIYALSSILFGVLNWYQRDHLVVFLEPYIDHRAIRSAVVDPLIQNLILGLPLFLIWLIPALIIVLIEIRQSQRPLLSAVAVTLFWLLANVSYYAIWTGEILLGRGLGLGDAQVPFATDRGWSSFWVSVDTVHMIVGGELRLYAGIAAVGGPIVGGLGGYTVLKLMDWRAARQMDDGGTYPHREPWLRRRRLQ
jgi:hypothetical protein